MGTEDIKTYCVYLITNMVNGKQYAGQTRQEWTVRWRQHVKCASSGKVHPLYGAIRKYGVESFYSEILKTGLTLAEADIEEEKVILEKQLCNRSFGYNISKGGHGGGLEPESVIKAMISRGAKKHPLCGDEYLYLDIPVEEMIYEYKNGLSVEKLAEKFGCSYSAITKRLDAAGIILRNKNEWNKLAAKTRTLVLPVSSVCEDYADGLNITELAEKYSCCYRIISNHLKENGVEIRNESETQKLIVSRLRDSATNLRRDVPDSLVSRLYQEGWSTRQIAEEVGLTKNAIIGRLKYLKIERRARGVQIARDRRFKSKPERIAYIQQIRPEA